MTSSSSNLGPSGFRGGQVSELEQVATGVVRVRAHNPGPMTLEGTNTWVLHGPAATSAVVIDPGPALPSHARTVRSALAERGLAVELVLLTHGHLDHSESAHEFAAAVGAPLRAADPQWCTGPILARDEPIAAAGLSITVIPTPGHTSDSVSFAVPGYIFTGDTVLGRGTTVVAHPDGRLGDYLVSLARLRARTADEQVAALLPGHGPVIRDATARLDSYLAHRHERLAAVAEVLRDAGVDPATSADADLDALVDEVVSIVYQDVPRHLWPVAALSVRAQVLYLAEGKPAQ